MTSVRDLFGRLRAFRVSDWGPDSAEMAPAEDREVVTDLNQAHVISSILDPKPTYVKLADIDFERFIAGEEPKQSEYDGERHLLLIDLDVPAYLVASSTPGHSHLYVDVPHGIPDATYWPLIRALAEAGVIEKGYASVSEDRGYTALRLPWIHKLMNDEKNTHSPEVPVVDLGSAF